MNKSDIVGRVADRMRLSKSAAESAVDIVLEAIAEALAKEEAVRIAGFGTFATRSRSARTGRNPATGERVAIAASKAPSFKAGKALRDAVNKDWNPVASDNANDWNKEQLAQGEDAKTLDVSDWPGGLAPVWTLLEHDSARALGAEPNAAGGALRFASDLDDGELEQSVFVRNALVLLKEMGAKETMWISSSGNCLTKECVTRLRSLISWPGLEATEHFRTGKTYRERNVWELHLLRVLVEQAGLIRSGGLWFELTPLGRAMLARKAGHAAGAAVASCVLGHGPLSLRARPSRRTAGVVAAGRDRRHPLGAVGGGGGLAECGHAHRAEHDPRRRNIGDAPEASVHDVRVADSLAPALVRAA